MDITAANASLSILVPPLFTTPEVLQQFAADDVFDLDEIESVETQMGVDGFLSGGFVWKPQPQRIVLMADSKSNAFFDVWNAQQAATRSTYPGSCVIKLPAVGIKLIGVVGYLTGYKLPGAKKLLTPRSYRITWQQVSAAPA